MRRTWIIGLLTVAIATALPAQPINPADYERILVPLAFAGTLPGAFGSLWTIEFHVRNRADAPIAFFWGTPQCGLPEGCGSPFPYPLPPGYVGPPPEKPYGNPGALMYAPKEKHSHLAFSLRVRDSSRQAKHWGTEIPVLREDDLVSNSKIDLLNIPGDAMMRHTLRIYDADPELHRNEGGARVIVRIRDARSGDTLGQRDVILRERFFGNPLPQEPGYAQIDSVDLMPLMVGAERFWAEIEPITPGRFWAFWSVTNNETQFVTVITPQ